MFSDPVKNIEALGIQAGMNIVDLGAGSGFYTRACAKALISTGKVFAVDAQKDLLTQLKNTATREGLYNVEVVWGDIEKLNGTHLRDSSMDIAILSNVLFQVSDRSVTLREAKRVLIPGGRLLLIDWADSFGGIGPKPALLFNKITATELCEKEGFSVEREIDAGSHHYGLLLKKL